MKQKSVLILSLFALLAACSPKEKVLEVSTKAYVVIVKTEALLQSLEFGIPADSNLDKEFMPKIKQIKSSLETVRETFEKTIKFAGGNIPVVELSDSGLESSIKELKIANEKF